MTRYQKGSLRVEQRSGGPTWVFRWYRSMPDGRRAETTKGIGLVSEIGKSESAAWRRVHELRLHEAINKPEFSGAPTFGELAASFLTHELDRLAHTTAATIKNNLTKHILPRWGDYVAVDIQPLEIERWFAELGKQRLAAPTVAKFRANMVQVFRHAQRQGIISRAEEANPLNFARASAKTSYRAIAFTAAQAAAIINQLEQPERILALLSAVTGLRISESLGLQWADVDFIGQQIHVRRTWIQGKVGKPKTDASAAPVPMTQMLADALREWRAETPYAGDDDWVFASFRSGGKRPREGGVAAQDYLRPAAIKAGVITAEYKGRLGWHNFRHGLASSLVSAGTDPKTVQGLLRHSKVQTTLDLYCHSVSADAMKAQEAFLVAMQNSGKAA